MPRHCSAGGCKSRDNRETRSAGITFHKLPKGAPRRSLWITNSHRAHSWDPQTDFVYFCSKHFTPDSFELTGCSGIRRLKEDAFPTVFNSSTTKCKGAGAPHTARKSLRSGGGEEADRSGASGQRSVAAAEDTNKNIAASSQAPSAVEQECDPAAAPVSRPLSPSCYMRRLPPPPGFYLPKEHSYAQLCPLLWRRRYDQAIDCLEKTLRQLHAARRRENRLRSTVLRLRDKRLKHTLLPPQDGCKKRSWIQGVERRRGRGGSHQEESDDVTDAKSEDTGLLEGRCEDQMELGDHFLPDTSSWSEEEKGYCFYCGRGQVSKAGTDVQPSVQEETLKSQRSDIQIVRKKSEDTRKSSNPETHSLHHGVCVSDEHSLQFLGCQQKLKLPDMAEGEAGSRSQEQHVDLQQLLWIKDSAEGQVLLLPLPAQHGLQRMERADETQAAQVSELDHMAEDAHQRSALNATPVEMGEDVREKLKEHLEGFHLQLSTEFTN